MGEVFIRWIDPTDSEEIRYKKIHCLKHFSEIRLCPNLEESFTRPDGKTWDIQTNVLGERIVSIKETNRKNAKVWLIGDSMAMGYGLPTKETIAYVLETKYQIPTRVLAVDAIGTNGIKTLFWETWNQTKTEDRPTHYYWIWNPSDYIDDEREKKGLKKFLYPLHFYLTRKSYLYQRLIHSPKENVYTNQIPYLYPESHGTYSHLQTFFQELSNRKEHWRILFAWGMAPSGKPDTKDPNYDLAKQFFQRAGLRTIDLRKETEISFSLQKQIYISNDGHPDRDLAKLFAEAIANDFHQE